MTNTELLELIKEFQNAVKEVVTEFYNVYGRKDLLKAVRLDRVIPSQGKLNSKVFWYAFHGIGLDAKIKGKHVDFDFGDNDRIDGFDAWRLSAFLNSQRQREQWSLKEIEEGLAKLEQKNVIYRPEKRYGNFYFIDQYGKIREETKSVGLVKSIRNWAVSLFG